MFIAKPAAVIFGVESQEILKRRKCLIRSESFLSDIAVLASAVNVECQRPLQTRAVFPSCASVFCNTCKDLVCG